MSDYDRLTRLRSMLPYLGLHDGADEDEIIFAVGKLVGYRMVAQQLADRIRGEIAVGEGFSDEILALVERLRR